MMKDEREIRFHHILSALDIEAVVQTLTPSRREGREILRKLIITAAKTRRAIRTW